MRGYIIIIYIYKICLTSSTASGPPSPSRGRLKNTDEGENFIYQVTKKDDVNIVPCVVSIFFSVVGAAISRLFDFMVILLFWDGDCIV